VLLISYLPSMYQSLQRREAAVAALGPAGGPVAGVGGLRRRRRDPRLPARPGVLPLAALGALEGRRRQERSCTGRRYWPRRWTDASIDAELCIRAGYVALRRIADFFNVRHNPDPHRPEDPISIDRNGSRIRRYNRSRA
jgi:hypothetical protein